MRGTFISQVDGDSMTPTLTPGDFVSFQVIKRPRSGSVVMAFYKGTYYAKRYRRIDGVAYLTSDNSKYPAVKIDNYENVMILGRLVDRIK